MKKIILFLTLIVFYNFCISQNPYYDALKLKSLSVGNHYKNGTHIFLLPDNNAVYKVMMSYVLSSDTNSKDSIAKRFMSNPFMQWDTSIISHGSLPISSKNILSSIGGLDVTNVADAFAKFLVKRTKAELNIAFFSKFNEFIKKYPDIKSVFPQTYNALTLIGEEIYNYERYLQTLRDAYEKDLSALPENLPSIVTNHPGFFKNYPTEKFMLENSCYIAGQLRDREHPGNILANYPLQDMEGIDPVLSQNLKGAVQTLQLISESLKDTSRDENANYWVSNAQFNKLISDPIAFKIYLGLLRQRTIQSPYNNISFTSDINLKGMLDTLGKYYDNATSEVKKYKDYISGFFQQINQLNVLIRNYKKAPTDSIAIEQYYNYFNKSINLLQYSIKVTKLPLLDKLPLDTGKVAVYFDVVHSAANLFVDITRRNYSTAIVNTVHIFKVIIADKIPNDEQIKDAEKIVKKAKNQEMVDKMKRQPFNEINTTSAGIADLQKSADILYKAGIYNSVVLANLFKLGTFMATIVQAKNSDEMASAIEVFALPQGSSRIKRESAFNVSLNAYAGVFLGYERIKGVDKCWFTGGAKTYANNWGVTAPIGISTSFSYAHHSFSAFVSFIDIGALVSFRFANDTASTIPNIQLKDIISPGLFLSWGIPKSPLSLNFGYQMGPVLRNVSVQTNQYSASYSRVSLSLVVDLPLLNFYTRSRK